MVSTEQVVARGDTPLYRPGDLSPQVKQLDGREMGEHTGNFNPPPLSSVLLSFQSGLLCFCVRIFVAPLLIALLFPALICDILLCAGRTATHTTGGSEALQCSGIHGTVQMCLQHSCISQNKLLLIKYISESHRFS